jgi:hypothetical protein
LGFTKEQNPGLCISRCLLLLQYKTNSKLGISTTGAITLPGLTMTKCTLHETYACRVIQYIFLYSRSTEEKE